MNPSRKKLAGQVAEIAGTRSGAAFIRRGRPKAGDNLFTVRRSEAFETAAEKGKRSDDRRGVLKHLPPSRCRGASPPQEEGASTPPQVVVGVASPPFAGAESDAAAAGP